MSTRTAYVSADLLRAAVARTHRWLDASPDRAGPEAARDGPWRGPDGCEVERSGVCRHGLVSWWLVQVSTDPAGPPAVPPECLVPRADRFAPTRADYVAALDAHHRAMTAGEAGYADPGSGLTALTARTLWARGGCCGSGCRHCPFADDD